MHCDTSSHFKMVEFWKIIIDFSDHFEIKMHPKWNFRANHPHGSNIFDFSVSLDPVSVKNDLRIGSQPLSILKLLPRCNQTLEWIMILA